MKFRISNPDQHRNLRFEGDNQPIEGTIVRDEDGWLFSEPNNRGEYVKATDIDDDTKKQIAVFYDVPAWNVELM